MDLRPLAPAEIGELSAAGCRSADWSQVRVAPAFAVQGRLREVEFSGWVELGVFNAELPDLGGRTRPTGVFFSSLHNVSLADDSLVRHSDLVNVRVGKGAWVNRVGLLAGEGESHFANGQEVKVLSEDGTRSVPLWRRLSATLAHILCRRRGRREAEALRELMARDWSSLASDCSWVGPGARVERSGRLSNIYLEEGARLDGVAELFDCYVASSLASPACLGAGVTARRVVFQRSSHTQGGVSLENCLVGEGTRLENGFSAEESLFFANSHFARGEAVAVFAGPAVVSHHRATLALAGEFSFANFGSASNASNHNYKLGPIHSGYLGRGARLGSGSYLLWPGRLPAFLTLAGRHPRHLDFPDFPFSILLESGGHSVLVPGATLFGVASYRDELKWRSRDARSGISDPLDLYQVEVLSPLTLGAADRGEQLLRQAGEANEPLLVGGTEIPPDRLAPGKRLYQAAGVFLTGLRLKEVAERTGDASPANLVRLLSRGVEEAEDWRDWGGLLLPEGEARALLAGLGEGRYREVGEFTAELGRIHQAYREKEWDWLAGRWRRQWGAPDQDKLARFLQEWQEVLRFRQEEFQRDLAKDFALPMRLDYGWEGETREADFRFTRGEEANHPLSQAMEKETTTLLAWAGTLTV